MRKEIFIAIFIGLIFGLVITYGIYTANKAIITKQKGLNPTTTIIPTPTPEPEENLSINISEPKNNLVLTEPKTTILGSTKKNAVVAIMTEDNNYLIQADNNGYFTQEIDLIKGANFIQITATDLDNDKISETKTLSLVYSTELEGEGVSQ
ncbi:hypothetical protein GYA19_05735 [Candidatus Beckwithbacteria bacterium]|nr:hypothetical protein [Candidatus Beckwithbacteria bacterium]